jgi:hypothetical protein
MNKVDTAVELNDLRRVFANKKCFDCGQSSTTYIISEFSIFVCCRCAGLHREFSHRAKGASMCTFTAEEVSALKGGNATSALKWHSALQRETSLTQVSISKSKTSSDSDSWRRAFTSLLKPLLCCQVLLYRRTIATLGLLLKRRGRYL